MGRARVCDFGLGWREQDHRLTQTGAFVGTPVYMPPERFGAKAKASATQDVWSLGVMLYEILTGSLPFEPDHGPVTLLAQIQAAKP